MPMHKNRNREQIMPPCGEKERKIPMKNLLKMICVVLAMLVCLSCAACAEKPAADRAGNPIALKENPERIVSLAPSITQQIIALGLEENLIAVDAYSAQYEPQLAHLPQFDMMTPDCEQMAMLNPDVVFVTGMSYVDGDDPFQALINMGVCVAVIPSSTSIKGVKEDTLFLGECLNKQAEAQALVDGMDEILNAVAGIGADIEDKKTVAFEISALPYLIYTGGNTYQDEMISLLGAVNAYADQPTWFSANEEAAVAANPDVILTSIDYIEDPVGEIMGRAGWENVNAVANGEVYLIDPETSGLPNHNIVKALVEMAKAIYPEAYADFEE